MLLHPDSSKDIRLLHDWHVTCSPTLCAPPPVVLPHPLKTLTSLISPPPPQTKGSLVYNHNALLLNTPFSPS